MTGGAKAAGERTIIQNSRNEKGSGSSPSFSSKVNTSDSVILAFFYDSAFEGIDGAKAQWEPLKP
jgi:hypothetical protein